ncbi:HlyC/CorC family transporter [Candidatus Poribacteria bacterium]|nr:HlyC/CorC family transporter [Candidatus Poribacteria bacterium]
MTARFLEETILLLILLSLSFFFNGAEVALFSLPRVVIERLKQTSIRGRQIAGLLEEPNRLLATILFGNLAANILVSTIIGVWVLRIFTALEYSAYLGSIVAILITTTLLLLFCDIAPKTIAINNAEVFALSIAIPFRMFSEAVSPLLRLLLLFTDSFLRLLGVKKSEAEAILTEEELKTLVAMGEEEGVLKSSERQMIHRIIELGDTLVRDVYVPRTDMVRVKFDITVEQLAAVMRETGHSRFPVYGKTVDDIRGIVYAKDLFPYFWRGQTNIPISRFIRPAYYVPQTKKVRDLLREFQSGRLHMAIVVDEYGGTAGLVTLEDLVEEVIGEIFDEYDVRKSRVERLPDGALRVDARMRLEELSGIMGSDISLPGYETVGGLVYQLLEHVPAQGESVEHAGLRFAVEDIRNRHIRTVRISPLPDSASKKGPEAQK